MLKLVFRHFLISIHAPRGGSDLRVLPIGEPPVNISIHAPRGGSDGGLSEVRGNVFGFNPRSPWGERQIYEEVMEELNTFQSTLPVGGATVLHRHDARRADGFNPRSPWGERLPVVSSSWPVAGFQSTLPVGGATESYDEIKAIIGVSIHAPRGGSDHLGRRPGGRNPRGFNPRSPWGERQLISSLRAGQTGFQSTLPVGGATAGIYL